MRKSKSEDTRIVYGFRCVWWGGIEDAGTTPPEKRQMPDGKLVDISIPCCPHCGSPLMEVPTPESWWKAVEAHEANGHPGYRAFVEWGKGKCFPSMRAAKAAYEAKPGRSVQL